MTNIIKIFNDGGIVMYPLLLASILIITLAIERLYFWLNIGNRQRRSITTVLDLYPRDRQLAIDRLKRDLDLPIAKIFLSAISIPDATPEEFQLAMASEIHAQTPILRRFINVFDTIIGLAPLLGLLGTVTGLINSFASLKIGRSGAETINVVGGISEALVSTATGVVVAILASVCANLFRNFYQRQIYQIQSSTSQLELIHRRHWYKARVNEGIS